MTYIAHQGKVSLLLKQPQFVQYFYIKYVLNPVDLAEAFVQSHQSILFSGVFSVKLVQSEASKRCGLEPGQYTLVVAPTALQLRDADTNELLLTWPYRYIRRYGHRTGRITFEAGRKCDSGEVRFTLKVKVLRRLEYFISTFRLFQGEFLLEHSNQQAIFRCMLLKMQNMRQMLNGDSSRSALCGDNQFRVRNSVLVSVGSTLSFARHNFLRRSQFIVIVEYSALDRKSLPSPN